MSEISGRLDGAQQRLRSLPLQVVKEPLRPFFTPRTLAEYLSIGDRTVRQLLADGCIESYMVGGSRRIDPVDVDAYLAAHRQRARR